MVPVVFQPEGAWHIPHFVAELRRRDRRHQRHYRVTHRRSDRCARSCKLPGRSR